MSCEVIALCGSTRFESHHEKLNRELTLSGKVVLPCGVYTSGRDSDLIEGLDTVEALALKRLLDDVQMDKIDMADSIYVINVDGHIGKSTWHKIVYAAMTRKGVYSIEDISFDEILRHMDEGIRIAEKYASWQLDSLSHNSYCFGGTQVSFVHNKEQVFDPWIRETQQFAPFAWSRHREPDFQIDPARYYGKKKFARYVFDTMQALYEYRQIEGHELFLPEYGSTAS